MRVLLLSLLLPVLAQAAPVFRIDLEGTINPGSADFFLESLRAAEEARADALVVRLNTPGGLLASTRSIIQGISESKVPVILWISPGGASATSAGALIALASHVVALAPGTNIGAAHPVGSQGEDVKGVMGEKVTNDTAALARAQAAMRGRSSAAAEAVVVKSKSFSAEEAVKEGLAEFLAGDITSLLKQATGRKVKVGNPEREILIPQLSASEVLSREMNAKQRFLHFVADPNVSAMLLTIGGLAAWAEVSSGFSSVAAGVIAVFCFVLALVSLQTLPVNVGGAVLMVLGFVLLIAEAYITSYGLLTLAALGSFVIGGLFLIDPSAGSMQVSMSLLGSVSAGVGLVVLGIGYLLTREKISAQRDPLAEAEAKVESVAPGGRQGTALVNGEIWNFETKEPVSAGDLCRVQSVHGLKIHLERKP